MAKQVQHHTASKMLHENLPIFKFDPTSSNMLQHNYRNRAAKHMQYVVTNNVARLLH